MAQELPVRIFLRPIGSPLTSGTAGLAVASLVQSGLDLRWISQSQTKYVGIMMLALPALLPLIACVFAYLARDGAAGAALGILGTTWLSVGVVQIVSPPHSTSGALGLLLVAAAGMLVLSSMAVFLAKPLPGLLLLLAAARFALTGAYHLSADRSVQSASGVIGLAVVALAAYAVLAFELEDQQRKAVLPTFRRGRARVEVGASPQETIGEAARDAGVRQTT